MGPILIFDKSTLEGLNPDEAMWLDNFFLTNITPLFFVETLADLEKRVRKGRSPEQVVGSLAYKTPDAGSRANVHHMTLVNWELDGVGHIDMRYGRPIIAGGTPVTLEGKKGVMFRQSPEDEALQRWQNLEFLEVERRIAKAWRQALSSVDLQETYKRFQSWFSGKEKPRSLNDVKTIVDAFLNDGNQEHVLLLGMAELGVSPERGVRTLARWRTAGQATIQQFAPYFSYVFGVDLFFSLAIATDLISRDRPSNKLDLAYLYYLPFCMVFASNDHLHFKVVPLFLRSNQEFVLGSELKGDLGKLDQHYSSLPEEVKNRGVSTFAADPPPDRSFLVTRLWDKFLPKWRERLSEPKVPMTEEAREAILKHMRRIRKESQPLRPEEVPPSDDLDHLVIERKVYARKGKWRRFPPEVEQAQSDDDD